MVIFTALVFARVRWLPRGWLLSCTAWMETERPEGRFAVNGLRRADVGSSSMRRCGGPPADVEDGIRMV